MCGIIGYVGCRTAAPILVEGLRRLEYRGYDSAGIAVLEPASAQVVVRKRRGKIDEGLGDVLAESPAPGECGIGHTRWATHGPPSDANSHPHFDGSGRIAVVHNGVIENFDRLKKRLLAAGHVFQSATDTEVLAHLIGEKLESVEGGRDSVDGGREAGGGARWPGDRERGTVGSGDEQEDRGRADPGIEKPRGEAEPSSQSPHGLPTAHRQPPTASGPPPTAHRQPSSDLLVSAVSAALREVIGTYGLAVVSADFPGVIVGARRGSPLLIGIGENENFLASDAAAVAAHTRQVVYLNDYDVVRLTAKDFSVTNLGADTARVQVTQLEFDAGAAERGPYPHFMLKEIFEQPQTVRNALRGRIDLEEATAKFGGLNMSTAELRAVDRIVIAACGTSWHAGLVGEYLFEEFAQIPTEVEYASEFRYRNAPLDKHTLLLVITQSGETADTLAGLREARRRGHQALALCNVVGSTIAREADGGIYLHAGPEIGVASTKAFTSQVAVLTLLALHLGRIRTFASSRGTQLLRALEAVPDQIQQMLERNERIRQIAHRFASAEDFFFIGRQYQFPVALEGALKLKEISYLHAEGYPAAEMKHGPIAMIDERTPSVVLAPTDALYEKTVSNLHEIKARRGPTIAVTTEGNGRLTEEVDELIFVPRTLDALYPLLTVVPLQLLAYHIAVARGCDVDKPRNLAKSVTVE
jgi:glucosamine--fructose-6-phosphate aminotransferase (isomerizing)